jgi:hypothetical protein
MLGFTAHLIIRKSATAGTQLNGSEACAFQGAEWPRFQALRLHQEAALNYDGIHALGYTTSAIDSSRHFQHFPCSKGPR